MGSQGSWGVSLLWDWALPSAGEGAVSLPFPCNEGPCQSSSSFLEDSLCPTAVPCHPGVDAAPGVLPVPGLGPPARPAPPALCTHRNLLEPPSPPPCPSLPPAPSAPCAGAGHSTPLLGAGHSTPLLHLGSGSVVSYQTLGPTPPQGWPQQPPLSASDCCVHRSCRPVCAVGSSSVPLCRNGGIRLVVPFSLSSRLHLGLPNRVGVSAVGTWDAPASECLRHSLMISCYSYRPWRCPHLTDEEAEWLLQWLA